MHDFISPKNIDELCQALKEKDKNTYVIAGGTDLIIYFSKKQIFDYNIVDITKLKELKNIIETETEISIGSCVTMTEIENNSILHEHIEALTEAAYNLGSQQIRNSATIGGNVANASQSGDTLPVLFAYDANVEIINSLGTRRIEKIDDVVEGLEKNNLNIDEIITRIIIKKSSSKSAFAKVGSREAVTISKINCCANINLNKDMTINEPVIYLGAVGPKPIRAKLIEEKILGKNINNINISEINDTIIEQIENAIPNRSSKYYKKAASEGLLEDVLYKLRGKSWNN